MLIFFDQEDTRDCRSVSSGGGIFGSGSGPGRRPIGIGPGGDDRIRGQENGYTIIY